LNAFHSTVGFGTLSICINPQTMRSNKRSAANGSVRKKKNIPEPTMAHTALHLPFPLKVVPARLCKTVQVTAPAPVEFVPPFFLYHAIAALRQGCQCCLDVRFGPRS
jgi:hypothetical protein